MHIIKDFRGNDLEICYKCRGLEKKENCKIITNINKEIIICKKCAQKERIKNEI